jgi:hypothetical protein
MLSMPILNGRIGKWILALSEFELKFESAKATKGQIIADFITEHRDPSIDLLEITPWALFFDGSSCAKHVHEFFSNLNTKQQRRELEKTKQLDLSKLGFFKLMSENSKELMMPILASTLSKENASMRKQTYVPSGLNAQERAVAEMPTQEVVKLLGFMEETRMPLGVALSHEEPPRDPSFEYRWPFQLGKPLVKPEVVFKLSPKMYKFHEWYMWQSLKGVHNIAMLAAPEDFATKATRWSGWISKIFMKFTSKMP